MFIILTTSRGPRDEKENAYRPYGYTIVVIYFFFYRFPKRIPRVVDDRSSAGPAAGIDDAAADSFYTRRPALENRRARTGIDGDGAP